ncbi:hypothetical protein AB0L74_31965 [Streptomyces sp. NPDC052020]|uniref:hypothetical protein n=1 Tax=Streptomyces sp. NPDC052020 TaxID=3155677 RepID=UPI003421B150
MNAIRKIATTLGCVTLAVSGVFFAAPTAQADINDCLSFLESQGYHHPRDVHSWSCSKAQSGELDDWQLCITILRKYGNVPSYPEAHYACDLAAP